MMCMALVLSVFVARLVQLQGLNFGRYRSLAHKQMLSTQTIPAVRGSITTSDGTVLAMTVQTDLVFADPALIPQAKRAHVASALAGPLGLPAARILADIEHPTSPEYVVLKAGVPEQAGTRISALNLPGIAERPTYTREYPNGDMAGNLVGFTTTTSDGELRGSAGLEYQYNSLLTGRDGTEEFEQGVTGQPIPGSEVTIRHQVPAGNLRVTIQGAIQWEAERACAAEVRKARAKTCSVVVMQPKTGRVLALAQYPPVNPAAPSADHGDIPADDVFQPGSTAKVITLAAALEHGGQTPTTAYTVPDKIVVDGFSFHDAEYHPTARYTTTGILANSLNDGMVQVAQHVSPQTQYRYFRAFGIGRNPGLNLPGASQGLLPPPSRWWGDERYTLSFGQGVAVTAVQMASVYATIANGGVRVQPSLVAGTTDSSGKFTPARAPRRSRVLRPKTAAELMRMLQQVPRVDASVGEPWGMIPGYTVAAKTGTAQMPDPARGGCLCEYGSSYIGITPASSPKLVVAVNVQDPRRGSYYGDAVAGPVFYHVAKFALQTMKVPPDGGHSPRLRLLAP